MVLVYVFVEKISSESESESESVKSNSELINFNVGVDIKNVAFKLSVIFSQTQLWKYNIASLQWVQQEQDR